MSVEEQDYQLEVLEYAVNQCIDRLLPSSSEDALSVILYQSNELVWRVATEIYSKSGHQVDFIFVRNILNLRIEPFRRKIAEEERIRAEQERIRKEQETEQARIRAEQERIRKEQEQRKLQEFREEYPDININNYKDFDIFIKIKNIIIDQLDVEEEQVKLDAIFSEIIPESYDDWRNRKKKEHTWCDSSFHIDDKYLAQIELIMAIEEEFDIEIPDEECDNLLSWNVNQLVNLVLQKLS